MKSWLFLLCVVLKKNRTIDFLLGGMKDLEMDEIIKQAGKYNKLHHPVEEIKTYKSTIQPEKITQVL